MENPSVVGGVAAVIAAVGLMAGCDNKPENVVGPGNSPQARVASLEIGGPGSIPPGQSVQFTATLRFSDGTSQTGANVRWSSHYGLIQVNATGLATARERLGEDTLTAEMSGPSGTARGSREILVLPDGTYRLVGVITEDVPPAAPVVGAQVDVTNGTALAAITDWDGRYVLYGVPGRADIRVTRDGYRPHVQSLVLAEHATQNFQLALSGVRLNLEGAYTLAIDASCATSTPVPEDLRHRSYAALLTQNGPALDVVLTESSRFRVNSAGRGDRFNGRVDAGGATFNLGDNFYLYYPTPYNPATYPSIVERVSNGTFLVLDGRATTRATTAGLTGELQGFFINHASTFPSFPLRTFGSCYSIGHRFTFTRRS